MEQEYRLIPPHDIKVDGEKIRNGNDIEALAASIKSEGLQQPLGVYEDESNDLHLVWGHRRLAAAKILGLREVPVMVVLDPMSESEAYSSAMIENMVREDMTPLQKAKALKRLMEMTDLTTEKIGKKFGYGQQWVSNYLALLDGEVQEAIESLPRGVDPANLNIHHVMETKAGLSSHSAYKKHGARVLRKVIAEGLSSRDARALAGEWERAEKIGGTKLLKTLEDTPFKQRIMADTDVKEAHIKSLYKESDAKTRKELAIADKARKKEQEEYAKEYGSIIKDDDYWNVKSSITFIFKALTRLQDVYIKTMNSKYVTIKNVEQKKKVQKFKKDTIKELRDLSNRCLEIANVLEYDMQKPKEGK